MGFGREIAVPREERAVIIFAGFFSTLPQSREGLYRVELSVPADTTIYGLITMAGATLDEVGLIVVDGRITSGDSTVKAGSIIKVFPSVGGG